MSSAGAQAVARLLPCWPCRPSAWASIGLIWAISSCASRRSWNGSHRVMVAIWSPFSVGRAARWLGEDADPGWLTGVHLPSKHCSQYTEHCSPVKVIVQELEHEGKGRRTGPSRGPAQQARD